MIDEVNEVFALSGADAKAQGPLQLAFLGDAIYETIIRTMLISSGRKAAEMSRKKTELVRAGTQAAMIIYLRDGGFLTEEEAAVFRRGRNANPPTTAKGASMQEYHKATGFEALIGYLYLKGQETRAAELVREGLAGVGKLD